MPTLSGERIAQISRELLVAVGATEGNATTVADHLADASLAGHDSHGFIRIIQYLREIGEGNIKPAASPETVVERGGVARVSGNGTFGQVVCKFATELAMEKARTNGIAFVATCEHAHTGRMGTYSEMVAKAGMACIVTLGTRRLKTRKVAPFGGREGRLGTNPISMGFPYGDESPIILDFATSIAAEGKVRVYRARGQQLPGEWLLSAEGKPSRDPEDLYTGGAILPMGGLDGGHKGYGLSFMVDLLGGAMGSLNCTERTEGDPTRGSSIIVIDLDTLGEPEAIEREVETLVRHVKDSPPMEGHDGVLYPGEIEARTRKQRQRDGVVIEDVTWDEVVGLIRAHGLSEELALVAEGTESR